MKKLLTIWYSHPPEIDWSESDEFYRWTFEYGDLFITADYGYVSEGRCRNAALKRLINLGFSGQFEVKYGERTNTEFIA